MKNLLLALTAIFTALCLVGCGYILYTHGSASAGYAVVPLLIAVCCSQGYNALKKKDDKQ